MTISPLLFYNLKINNMIDNITLKKLTREDFIIIVNALKVYNDALIQLLQSQNKCVYYIHSNIVEIVMYNLGRKLTGRSFGKTAKLKLEIHQAFIVHDALQHFTNVHDNELEKSVCRRILLNLHPQLPNAIDTADLSVNSGIVH